MHRLVIGTTLSGKTYLCKRIARELKEKNFKVAVLDPFCDPQWPCDFITSNGDKFLDYVKRCRDHFLFIDESLTSIGRYNDAMAWLATSSRHLGHSATFVGHKFTSIQSLIRTNTSRSFFFASDFDSAKLLSTEYRESRIMQITDLRKGEFLILDRFPPNDGGSRISRGRIDFASGAVYTVPLEESHHDEIPDDIVANH